MSARGHGKRVTAVVGRTPRRTSACNERHSRASVHDCARSRLTNGTRPKATSCTVTDSGTARPGAGTDHEVQFVVATQLPPARQQCSETMLRLLSPRDRQSIDERTRHDPLRSPGSATTGDRE